MRSMRWMFGVLALAAAFGLGSLLSPAGLSRAEEKEKEKEKAPAKEREEVERAAKDIATACALIEYGQREKDPKPILVGILILNKAAEPDGAKIEVEGEKDAKAPEKPEQLRDLLNSVRKMEGADKSPV